MPHAHRASHGFFIFCLVLATYLSVGGYLQSHYGSWGIMANQVGFLLLPALLYSWIAKLPQKVYFPWARPSWTEVLIIVLFTALMIALIEVLVHFQNQYFPLPKSIETFYEDLLARKTWWDGILQVLALVLIPAFCEEFFFRGFLFGMFEHRFSQRHTLILTALFFALSHMNPWYLLYYFILGLFLGGIRLWRNNLMLCILAHALNNIYSLFG